MKKWIAVYAAFMLALGLSAPYASAEDHGDTEVNLEDIELSQAQQQELEALHNEMFQLHEQLVNKYVEFGVLSEEKAKKKMEHLEKHQEKLKENGYVPYWKDKRHKHKDEEE
ncbi:Protein of unknown function [Salinibacillus kushneri]|uniref:DUF2680 domain-containing protein n=1 Tax=Salinibacillus kushneri TaxID=237682 RepID=A0A1I0CMG4_9BACI|nr:DUF2680 domain-containing protein [Salinibacillus kushneri]SET20399.1 Protein of unknown function [Salinibacillus kushneri]